MLNEQWLIIFLIEFMHTFFQRARAQHIVPCTISQLLSATLVDEVFRIGNIEISQVTIVGIIRNAEKAATNIVYKTDDVTAAPMDVRQWADTDDASGENTVVPPETYVKVAGHLRSFQNKKSLVAFKIMPLEDMNEFTTRILEVVNAHMMLSKSNSQPSQGERLSAIQEWLKLGTSVGITSYQQMASLWPRTRC